MELKIKLSTYLATHLANKFGSDKAKWSDFVSRFLEKDEAELTNWSGLPYCWQCGEDIDPDVGDELVQTPDGVMHRHCLEGHGRRYE